MAHITQMELAEELVNTLKLAGFEPTSYSGRGMFGRQCVAVSDVSLWDLAKATGQLDVSQPYEDTLGRGKVFYWQYMPWPEQEESDGGIRRLR